MPSLRLFKASYSLLMSCDKSSIVLVIISCSNNTPPPPVLKVSDSESESSELVELSFIVELPSSLSLG